MITPLIWSFQIHSSNQQFRGSLAQGQVDDRDRTIRLQKNLIEQLEAEKHKAAPQHPIASGPMAETPKECVTTATQTERVKH